MDSLSQATLSLLGLTFSLFWIEIYLQFNYENSEDTKKFLLTLALSGYLILSIFIFTVHTYVVYYEIFGLRRSTAILYLDAIFAVLVSSILIFTGFFLIKKVRIVYAGPLGDKVSARIKVIIAAISLIYLCKCALSIIVDTMHSKLSTSTMQVIFIILYLAGAEIFPLAFILFFLKPTNMRKSSISSSIPSALLSHISSYSKADQIICAFINHEVFSEFSYKFPSRRSISEPYSKHPNMVPPNSAFKTLAIN